ncbi:MAG: helix-turn-helix transcriptional regulator [Candidatus Paceibacterota bacterium]|jgi:DNA-binding XRE family transcriptional regulator
MKIKNGIKLHTFEETFKKSFKSENFRKTYNEETVRLKMVQQIKGMRRMKKITQKELAQKTKMPQSAIARIESGKHSFSLGTLNRIARAFGKEVVLV